MANDSKEPHQLLEIQSARVITNSLEESMAL